MFGKAHLALCQIHTGHALDHHHQPYATMLPTVHIPVGVSTEKCLSWSPDGELAIAAGEEVYILLPRHNDTEPWTHVRIPANAFTDQEWPWQEQTSFKDMAIGEEQAKVTVTAVAWSPSGLAKHRRSVLAVLTSNLLLSLWTSESDPADPESWERVLIVNDALLSRRLGTSQADSRLSQRVRSMAWAPTCEQHTDRETPFSKRKWGIFMMAITDDNNRIHFVTILSPLLGSSTFWDAQSFFYKKLPVEEKPVQRPSLLSLAMHEKHFVEDIFFADWTAASDIPVIYYSHRVQYQELMSLSLGPPLEASLRMTDILKCSSENGFAETSYVTVPVSPFHIVSPFTAQIRKKKEKYGIESNQGEDVVVKKWGIAYHKGLEAACITLHPSKLFEHTAPAEDSAIVLFDNGTDIESAEDKFPWQSPPEVDETGAQQRIFDTIFNGPQLRSLALSNLDLKIIYGAMYATMLTTDDQRARRFPAIIEALNLVGLRTGVDFSPEEPTMIDLQVAAPTPGPFFVEMVKRTNERRARAILDSDSSDTPLLDSCPICSAIHEPKAIIYFESVAEAYCPQKHPFGKLRLLRPRILRLTPFVARCALTFLPILEPGLSKQCADCGREYLNEMLHPEIQQESLIPGSTPSLANLLFDKFDTCPYCGGKYYH